MSQGMEQDVRTYLVKVLNSLSLGLLWMTLNVLTGLYWGFGLVGKRISVYNLIYFFLFLVSLAALLYFFYRIWKR
jgi:hypothetical protein